MHKTNEKKSEKYLIVINVVSQPNKNNTFIYLFKIFFVTQYEYNKKNRNTLIRRLSLINYYNIVAIYFCYLVL